MRPLLLIALVCLLSVLLLPSGLPTAQAQATTTLYQNFDDLDDISYTLVRGTVGGGETGNGVRSNGGSGNSAVNDAAMNAPLHIILDIPSWCVLQSITWRESGTRAQSQAFNQLFLHRELLDSGGLSHWFTINAGFDFAWRTASIVPAEFPWSEGGAYGPGGQVQLYYGGSNTGDTLIFDTFEMVCEGGQPLIRPFSLEDELNASNNPLDGAAETDVPMGDYRWAQDRTSALYIGAFKSPYMVAARSSRSHAPVLAAGDGVIESVEPFSKSWCANSSELLTVDRCIFALPTSFNVANFLMFYISDIISNAGLVRLRLNDGSLIEYFVDNPARYVHPGLVVRGGCILGESIPFKSGLAEGKGALEFLIDTIRVGLGGVLTAGIGDTDQPGVIFMFRPSDEPILSPGSKLLDELTVYAEVDQACNVDPELADCLTSNPQMTDGDGWTSFGQVTWLPNSGGALLAPGASVFQSLNLIETPYTVKALVNPVFDGGSNHRLRLQLGTLSDNYTIDSSGIGGVPYQLTGDPDPDYGGMGYTVGVTNTGTSNIIVKYVCVEAGETGQPTGCTFTNPTFESDLSGWTPSDASVVWRQGSAYIPIGQHLTQGAPLPPGSYVLEFDVRIAFDPLTYTGGGGISVNVYRPDGASGNYPLDINWNRPGGGGYPITAQRVTITFEQIAPAGNFVRFEPVLDTPATGIMGIFLDRACLYLTSQGPSDGGGQCARPSAPISSEVGAWTAWHWANLNRFFTCDLMILLTQQYNFIQTSTNTLLMTVRWFMASINYTATWLGSDFVPWLNGHFRNIAIGQVTTIDGSGGASLWDVLLAYLNGFSDVALAVINEVIAPYMDILVQVADVLLWAFTGATQLLLAVAKLIVIATVQLIVIIFSSFTTARDTLSAFALAFNSVPVTTIEGLPQCGTDPRSHGFCIALWILDNTIFSGSGRLIMPLLVSIGSIHLLIWVIERYKKLITDIRLMA